MIEWEETDRGLRVSDSTKTEIEIRTSDWRPGGPTYDIHQSVDTTVSGWARELRFPPGVAHVTRLDRDEEYEHGSDTGPLDLPDGEYLINLHGNIKTYVRFSGAARLRKTPSFDQLIVSFPERTAVTLGFRSHHESPIGTVTVPPTPDGLATAIGALSASHKAIGPDCSYPTLRGHPPRIRLGDETEVPEAVAESTVDVGIELRVPDRFDALFVAAPLAYYLQANVIAETRDAPVLRAPAADFEHAFSPLPEFQHQVADVLRRVFLLDCLVRNSGPHSWDLAELSLLPKVGVDPDELYHASPAARLEPYLSAPLERIDGDLPDWHLSMYVDPKPDNVPSLPYLLDNLALVYLPESSNLNPTELLDQSLDDFYRSQPSTPAGELVRSPTSDSVRSVERVQPELHHGRVHGWLADGVPIDVYKARPTAYGNRFDYLGRDTDSIEVTVVLNDRAMDEEHENVADIYLERSEHLPIDVTVAENLTTAELANVFETPGDFVHYIGHCEETGLRCIDGNLPISDIEESNAQTFFLNACGSYYEGLDLIEHGSVAGAVTFNKVLNRQAAKVGVSFARLLINGFSIDRALHLSRRRIMMSKDYTVVGDGTHVLTQCDNHAPSVGTLREDGEQFELTYDCQSVRMAGSGYQVFVSESEKTYLHGTEATFTLDVSTLTSFLDRAKIPVIYDGQLFWSDELAEYLDA